MTALFASGLQRSDALAGDAVAEAVRLAVRQLGVRGCAAQMAQEFGDHPEAVIDRMRWIRQVVGETAPVPLAGPSAARGTPFEPVGQPGDEESPLPAAGSALPGRQSAGPHRSGAAGLPPGLEAERLCDCVAILNRTLRTIGRPDELREHLFASTLAVKTLAPLLDPDRVFGGLEAVDSWCADGAGGYVVAVSDQAAAAPAVTRALVAAGADVLAIGESRHSLEDVYLELVNQDAELEARRG